MMVDHNEHTVWQHVGWPYKTCAYVKFGDILYAWLETGDPYYLDNTEMVAEQYYAWFRANWPRNTVGRDNFGVSNWALMYKYLDTEHARDRVLELLRMNQAVVRARSHPGGQMGAGPHPGYHPSLYLTSVAIDAFMDAAECLHGKSDQEGAKLALDLVRRTTGHFMRDDVEWLPDQLGQPRRKWYGVYQSQWITVANRVYRELARFRGAEDDAIRAALAKADALYYGPLPAWNMGPDEHYLIWPDFGGSDWVCRAFRDGTRYRDPHWADALLLGARWTGQALEINPIGEIDHWPREQTILAPPGDVSMHISTVGDRMKLKFDCQNDFAVTVRYRGHRASTTSRGMCLLPAENVTRHGAASDERWHENWQILAVRSPDDIGPRHHGWGWIEGEVRPAWYENHPHYGGPGKRVGILALHPVREDHQPARIRHENMAIPPDNASLVVEASGHARGDFVLQCFVNGEKIGEQVVDGKQWHVVVFDLSEYAGATVDVELWDAPGGKEEWAWEHCYIDKIHLNPTGDH